jgi:hypothetical protein
MKNLTIFSTGLFGLACVLFALGTWEAVGCPRMITNPYLSRDGTWIRDPTGFSDEELQWAGSHIGSEINSLRSVIKHNYDSNGHMALSALSAIAGGLLAVIRIKTMPRQAPQRATEPPPLPPRSSILNEELANRVGGRF